MRPADEIARDAGAAATEAAAVKQAVFAAGIERARVAAAEAATKEASAKRSRDAVGVEKAGVAAADAGRTLAVETTDAENLATAIALSAAEVEVLPRLREGASQRIGTRGAKAARARRICTTEVDWRSTMMAAPTDCTASTGRHGCSTGGETGRRAETVISK